MSPVVFRGDYRCTAGFGFWCFIHFISAFCREAIRLGKAVSPMVRDMTNDNLKVQLVRMLGAVITAH